MASQDGSELYRVRLNDEYLNFVGNSASTVASFYAQLCSDGWYFTCVYAVRV